MTSPKRFLGFFLLVVIFLSVSENGFAQKNEVLDFNSSLRQAFRYSQNGHYDQALPVFEKLLAANPDEWIVYDLYSRAHERQGNYKAAASLYRQALEKFPLRKEEIEDRLKSLGKWEAFEKAMQEAPSWDKAQVYGSSRFLIKSNIPSAYIKPLEEKMDELLQQEMALLNKIFGASGELHSPIKLIIFGRREEYQKYNEENQGKGRFYSIANYDRNRKELIFYFYGSGEWSSIAQEMVHHLLRELYIPNPSTFIEAGMATYLAFKLQKGEVKSDVLQNIEFLNWLFDQGELEHAFAFFRIWKDYEKDLSAIRHFYIVDWSLTHFFLEGNDPFFKDFFLQYLQYEKSNDYNNEVTAEEYFSKKLSSAAQAELDEKWGKYCLNLTYDKV
jgi:tetratricopeptide (TPR) repeat protein